MEDSGESTVRESAAWLTPVLLGLTVVTKKVFLPRRRFLYQQHVDIGLATVVILCYEEEIEKERGHKRVALMEMTFVKPGHWAPVPSSEKMGLLTD